MFLAADSMLHDKCFSNSQTTTQPHISSSCAATPTLRTLHVFPSCSV